MASKLSGHVKEVYKATRFSVVKDTWPPVKPKNYTPLVLLYHEDEHIMKDNFAITKALHSGCISDVISVTNAVPMTFQSEVWHSLHGRRKQIIQPHPLYNHKELKEVLRTSKTTKEVSEILAPLKKVSDNPQTIIIEGAPGIGKTILLKHIAYCWAEKRMLQNYELVLLVYLRDSTVQKMSSLEDLFQYFCKPYGSNATKNAVKCSEYFLQNGGKTLILLLDGYDELPTELKHNSLIADILNRHILPCCGLVVSSRPHASILLREQATLRVDILGFTEEEQKQYIKDSLNDQAEIEELTTYLEHHIIIASLCYVPFNIVLLLFLYKQKVCLPKNATELYNMFICLTICRNISKHGNRLNNAIKDINNLPEPYNEYIQQLSKLALHGLNKSQLIFTFDEIKQFYPHLKESTPEHINAFGLLQAIEHVSIFQPTTTFSFLHLSVQEFLAANHIPTLTPNDELSILKKYFWSDIHSNMFTFYITLTKGHRCSFKEFLSGGDSTTAISGEILDDNLKCIHLYRCLNEVSCDDRVCRAIEQKFANGLVGLSISSLSPVDVENIGIFLTQCCIKQWQVLDLTKCTIRERDLQILHRILTSSSITIKWFALDDNSLLSSCDGWIADIVIACEVEQLYLDCNKGIGQTEEFFPTILSTPSSMLWRLDINDVKLSCKSATVIFTLLKERKTRLKDLRMAKNDITDDACNVIAEALQDNCTLKHLDIHGNNFSKEAIKLIMMSLRQNDILTKLRLPERYPKYVEEQISIIQDIVNVERKCYNSDPRTLKIFYDHF